MQPIEDMNGHELPRSHAEDALYRRRVRWGLSAFVALALLLVAKEHGAHLLSALPWLVLLACAVAHRFLHGHQKERER
jgi:hypothetical protein